VQLAQIQELQAKLDEERERLRLLQQTLEREHAAHMHDVGAREKAHDINHRIIEDRVGEPLVFNRASQNIVVAAMLLRNMPEPSTSEARQACDEIRGLLDTATMQQAKSSTSRRHALASEQPAEPS
jgi:tyrosyl-tRNA synthetase